MNWKLKLEAARKLVGRSNVALYDRVKLLVDVYEDPDFLDFHENVVDKAEAELDGVMGDYGISFLDARDMLRHFPKKVDWERGQLRAMLAETVQARIVDQRQHAEPAKRTSPVARKEFEQVVKQKEVAEGRAESLADENQRLREENRRLQAELARAEGRISELQRMLQLEHAA